MKKITFFLCALFISAMSFAETATLSSISTKNVATQSGASVSTTFGGVTCTVTKNSGNQPGFYTSSGIVRYYAKDVMTLSVESGYAITRIDFTMYSGSVGTASPEGLSSNTWTGNAESVSFTGGNTVKISKIVVTYEAYSASDVIVKTLKSIAVEGMTTTYEQGDIFGFDGTCTATYSVVKNDVDQEDETKPVIPVVSTPNMEQMGTQTITVSYTDDEVTVTTTYDINVIENTVTAGQYSIVPNNDFWGTNFSGSLSGDDLNKVYTGKQDDITIQYSKGTGSNLYINNFQTRTYKGTALTISVPTGYVLTSIAFTADGNNWEDGQTANVGTMTDSKNWTGSANAVIITFGGKCRITEITVSYEELADDAVTSPTISGTDEFIESTEVTIAAEDGLKVYYTLNGEDPTNASTEYTAPFELTATTTVKAVAYDGEKASDIISKTFKQLQVLTCEEAAELCAATESADKYVIRGYVTDIATAWSDQYSNISFWMADTKDGGQVFEAFRVQPIIAAEKSVKVGDYVEVIGKIILYGTTPETTQGGTYTIISAPVTKYTVTATAENGTVEGAGTYEEGTEVTLTATPAEGYEFVKWTSGETEVSTANPFTFTVTSDTTLVANFKEVVVEPTEVTVYCINSSKWDVVACHHWVEGGSTTAWPGDVMTKTEETVNGFDVYAATFTIEHTYCIFNNNNNGSQTGTLTVENGHYYYVKDAKWYASLADVPALDPLATDVYLAGEMNEWSTVANEFRKATEDATTASLTLTLEAATTYEFKVVKEGIWLGNGGTITASVEGWTFKTDAGNCKLTTDAAGEYVLTWDLNTNKLTVTYPELVPAVYKDITVTIGTAGFTGSTPTIKWWGAKGLANATEPQEMTATGFGGRYSYTFEQVDSVTGVNFYVELGGLRSKTITLHETPASYSQFYNILQNVYVKGGFNDWNDNDQLTKKSQDYKAISGIVQLKADTTYEFKITVNGDWYGNAQAITKDATTAKFADNDKNATITTTLAGGYTFTYNYLDSTLSVVYPVSVALDLGECTPAYNDEGIILESEDGTTVTIYNYQDGEYVHGDEIDVRASIEHNGKGNWDLFDGKGSWQVVNDVQNLVTTTLVNDDKTGYYTITATCALPQKHTLTLTGEYDVEEYGMGSITTFTATTEEDKALVVQISNEEGMISIMGTLDDVHMTISETWEVVDGEDDTKTLTFTGTLSNGDTYDVTLTATKKVYPTVAIVNAEVTVDGTSLVMTGKLYEQTVTCTIWEYKGEGNYEWLEIVSDDYSIYWGGVTPAELTEDGTNYTLTGVFTDYSEKYNVIFTTKSVATSLDNVEMGTAPVKVIENGQLIIIRDDIKYNVQGAVVK